MSTAPFTSPPISVGAREAARALGVSARTVEALAAIGELPSFRVGRRRLFSVEALRAWVRERAMADHAESPSTAV